MIRLRLLPAALLLLATPSFAQSSSPSGGTFSLELNRLDGFDGGCRVTLVENNGTSSAFASLKLDLVVFGGDGIVGKRVGVEAGPLKAGRTSVRTFDLKGLACDGVGRLLINDVLSCEAEGFATDAADVPGACLDALEPRSRVSAAFDK
ncbi:hypothetical protein [Pleomorphomonas koreensis]|uniref:hypothetical protein n=1 Tax=Pleomorphomonas koreensis TaxID=257440 RepID=UPI0004180179|nr:hypothetical protein [Pleomorphomonas koreensis]